jgi:hypothetical protein
VDRLALVKIVTPEPETVDWFLREVVQIPEGWPLGEERSDGPKPVEVESPARDPEGNFTLDGVWAFRGDSKSGGRVTGSPDRGQFQILRGDKPHIWAVAIGTRDLEGAHQRCVDAGIRCTEQGIVPFGRTGDVGYFYAEVGGIVFEVMRVGG